MDKGASMLASKTEGKPFPLQECQTQHSQSQQNQHYKISSFAY